jgi:hypothetical protein
VRGPPRGVRTSVIVLVLCLHTRYWVCCFIVIIFRCICVCVPTGLLHSLLGGPPGLLEGACGCLLGGSLRLLYSCFIVIIDLALVTVLGCLGSRVFVPLMIVLSEFSFTCIGINGKAASAVSTVCLFSACLCLTIVMLGQ